MVKQAPEPRRRRPAQVICAGFDWDHPSPLRHLETALAPDHDILHVESLGLRRPRPRFHDVIRLGHKAVRLLRPPPSGADRDGVNVMAPLAIPLPGNDTIRLVNGWLLERRARGRVGDEADVHLFLTALPTALEFMLRVRARVRVYYRVDDWPRWPGVDGPVIADLERRLMDRVDLTVATSGELARSGWSRRGPAVHLPQAVDREHFGQALSRGPVHPALEGLPGPVLGAIGLFDDRIDGELLSALAAEWPGTVVLAGERVGRGRRLPDGGSLRWIGHVEYDDLPTLARGVDAWILPYVVGPRTDAIDPLKLREYLATGRPVVSTPLPELKSWGEWVSLATTPAGFVAAARSAAADPDAGRSHRLDALSGHDWLDRRRDFLRLVDEASRAR